MEKGQRKIYCEGGYYDVDDKIAEFKGNPQYSELDKKATSDLMQYNGKSNEINLYHHVKYVSADTQLEGDTVLYNEKSKVLTYWEKAILIRKKETLGLPGN
jgi:lipopolysaccharide export system protein LptA